MNKVLVFTNYDSWYGLQEIRNRVDWYDSFPEMNNPLVKCVVEPGAETRLQTVDDLSEEGVYLVYDEMFQDELTPLLDECKRENDKLFILFHTNGNYNSSSHFEPWKEICTFVKGMHVPKSEYERVFGILTDKLGDETNRIIHSTFLLKVITGFLRECHTPQKELDKIQSYQILCEQGFGDAMKAFKAKYETSENYFEYKEDLENLRSLLEKEIEN